MHIIEFCYKRRPTLSPSLPPSTVVGICGKDGVVLGVEKLITSKLHEVSSNKRLFTIDRHVGIVSPSYIASS